jgi:hypothetical protein
MLLRTEGDSGRREFGFGEFAGNTSCKDCNTYLGTLLQLPYLTDVPVQASGRILGISALAPATNSCPEAKPTTALPADE